MNEVDKALSLNPKVMGISVAAGATAGNCLDTALETKADKSEIARLDAALAGKETAGSIAAHNDSATAHPDIRANVTNAVSDALSCHNSNANAHTDLRNRVEGKVDKVTGMGLSSNDYTTEEKNNLAVNTSARHIHNNKSLLDSYTQTEANLSDAAAKKHYHENKSVLDGITAALLNGWNSAVSHIADGVKHITVAERAEWNGKADKNYVDAEMQNKANVDTVKMHRVITPEYFNVPFSMSYLATMGPSETVGPYPNYWSVDYTYFDANNGIQEVTSPTVRDKYYRTFSNGTVGKWQQIATATPPQVFDLPLTAGFTANSPCFCFKTQENVVFGYMRFFPVGSVSPNTLLATLPVGYRPSSYIEMTLSTGQNTIGIFTNGNMIIYGSVIQANTLCLFSFPPFVGN